MLFPDEPAHGRMEFTGEGREYFRIWIVNLALSIATLGVYSAWAKARRLQFFYRHTRLDGASFDFHGEPTAILKGRVVALTLFALYSTAGWISGWVLLATIVMMAAVLPWLMARSFRFRLHNTSHRGIRFRFTGPIRSAYWVFLAMPVFSVLSLFTLVPLWHHRMRRYQHDHAAYGTTRFTFRAPASEFYVIYAATVALAVGAVLGLVALFFTIGLVAARLQAGEPGATRADLLFGVPVALFSGSAFVGLQAFVTARVQTLVWEGTHLGRHHFLSFLKTGDLFRVLWVNLFTTVLTLGLFRPFAQVRLARYMTSQFMVSSTGDVGEIVASAPADGVTAAGEEAAEFFDFDIAF